MNHVYDPSRRRRAATDDAKKGANEEASSGGIRSNGGRVQRQREGVAPHAEGISPGTSNRAVNQLIGRQRERATAAPAAPAARPPVATPTPASDFERAAPHEDRFADVRVHEDDKDCIHAAADAGHRSVHRPAARADVVQRKISKNGRPLTERRLMLLCAARGWNDNPEIMERVLGFARDEKRQYTWGQVQDEIITDIERGNAEARARAFQTEADARDRRLTREGWHGDAEMVPAAANEPRLLRRDAEQPVRPPSPVLDQVSSATGMAPLFTAGRATNAAFATQMGDSVTVYGRASKSKQDRTWRSGRAARNDELKEDAAPRHANGVYHAEEKVVKSQAWIKGAWRVIRWARRSQQMGKIFLFINRSSCAECTAALLAGKRYLERRMEQAGVDVGLIEFNVSVLGAYSHGRDEDLRRLQDAGWKIAVHPGPGGFTEVGYQQIVANLNL